ncbi:MAG: electron transport complex subunit RsxE [Oscillospiraceae bacterium]
MEAKSKKRSGFSILIAGIIKENPVLVLLLGTCPTLAVTTQAFNGLGMGLATMFVLICSNFLISLLKNVIPDKVRIPCYIVIIAGFVTILQLLVKAYLPALDAALGLYLSLITVNCIILGRAEAFASKNSVGHSLLDAIGMGFGFTLALLFIGSIREILGLGTLFGFALTKNLFDPIEIFRQAPGGFLVFGVVVALVNKLVYLYNRGRRRQDRIKVRTSVGCDGCPVSGTCPSAGADMSDLIGVHCEYPDRHKTADESAQEGED